MVNPYKLDMYLATQTADLFAELQAAVCADIDFTSCLPEQVRQAVSGEFAALILPTAGQMIIDIWRPSHSLIRRCRRAGYRSVLVAPAKGGLASLDAFSPEKHLVAINEAGSFSGAITFSRRMFGSGKHMFPRYQITGSHIASLGCIARADAMLASIDCLSFQMALHETPEVEQQIRVLGYTDPFPGLPFVTSAQMPEEICELMTGRLVGS